MSGEEYKSSLARERCVSHSERLVGTHTLLVAYKDPLSVFRFSGSFVLRDGICERRRSDVPNTAVW